MCICCLIFLTRRKRKKHQPNEHQEKAIKDIKVNTEAVCAAAIMNNDNLGVENVVRVRQVSLLGRRYRDTCREVQEWESRKINNYNKEPDKVIVEKKLKTDEIDIMKKSDIINNNIGYDQCIINDNEDTNVECNNCQPVDEEEHPGPQPIHTEIHESTKTEIAKKEDDPPDNLISNNTLVPPNSTVFYCSEGCFDLESNCSHQTVVLPYFHTRSRDT